MSWNCKASKILVYKCSVILPLLLYNKLFIDTFNEPSVCTVKAEKKKNDTDVTLWFTGNKHLLSFDTNNLCSFSKWGHSGFWRVRAITLTNSLQLTARVYAAEGSIKHRKPQQCRRTFMWSLRTILCWGLGFFLLWCLPWLVLSFWAGQERGTRKKQQFRIIVNNTIININNDRLPATFSSFWNRFSNHDTLKWY